MKITKQLLAEYALRLRKKTLKLLESIPEKRHNWRPTVHGYSLAELAYSLHKADLWLSEKMEAPERTLFPRSEIQHYDRQEELFVRSLLELDRWQEKRIALVNSMSDSFLSEQVFDERFGSVSWLQLILEGYLAEEIRCQGMLEVSLQMLS